MFSRLHNRIEIQGVLKAETGLYIGAGQESFDPLAVQGSLLKDVSGMPYIPGSSLKGVLRSFLESVQEEMCERGNGCLKKHKLANKEGREKLLMALKGDSEALAETVMARSCQACRLFGSGVLAGKVKLRDAYLACPDSWSGTELRTGNAIERDIRTTSQGALFDTEYIPSGTAFAFRLMAENLTIEDAKTLGALLDVFAGGGITVGGRSRAGLGDISVGSMIATLTRPKTENRRFVGLETFEFPLTSPHCLADQLEEKNAAAPEPQDRETSAKGKVS